MHVHVLQNLEYCKLGFSWEYMYTHLNSFIFFWGGGYFGLVYSTWLIYHYILIKSKI